MPAMYKEAQGIWLDEFHTHWIKLKDLKFKHLRYSDHYNFNKSSIDKISELSLNKIVDVLNQFPEMSLTINAHTDDKGSAKYNLALSQRRAKSTVEYLIAKGIAKERLTFKGYGESKPLNDCTNCTPEQDQANRRVEFKINKPKTARLARLRQIHAEPG